MNREAQSKPDGATGAHDSSLKRELVKLVEHSHWANGRWVEFVYSQTDAETRPRELLGHIIIGERIWFERIEGQQKTNVFFPLMKKEELIQLLDQNAETFRRFIETRLDDTIYFRRSTGEEYHARVIDIIHHLLTHRYHHRGQLAMRYARTGAKYPNTDHINFLIENRL